jgi:DNA-binding transcriptional ArsR family regulator
VTTYQSALDALADPSRRAVLERLRARPMAVGELASELPISRPAVSQHLRVLKDAGLVGDEVDGRRRIYHLDPKGLVALQAYLEGFWAEALADFKTTAEIPPSRRQEQR